MTGRRIAPAVALLVFTSSAVADAQVVQQQPTRPSPGLFGGGRPEDPNRARHELTLFASLLSGYGDVLSPEASSGGLDPAQTRSSRLMATGDVALQHYYGRSVRLLRTRLRAFSTAYEDAPTPSIGVSLDVTGSVDLGRLNTLRASQDVAYEPSLVLGAFTPLEGDVDVEPLPESAGGSGVLDQRSLRRTSSVSLERRWTPRQSTGISVMHANSTYLDRIGYDSTTLGAGVTYTRNMSRSLSFQSSYRYADVDLRQDEGEALPLTDHTVEGGFAYQRRLSATRRIQLSAGGGASQVRTISYLDREPVDYVTPAGYGSFRVDVGRSWSVNAHYRRAVNVLQGVTLESFPTDAARVGADGRLGNRVDAAVFAGIANGRSSLGAVNSDFQAYSGSAQLRIAIARCCAPTVNYQYISYQLQGVADLPAGVPREFQRHSISIGFTLFAPLYGSFPRTER